MQLQSVPGEPVPPFDPGQVAAAELAKRGTILLSGPLDDESAARAIAQVLGAPATAAGRRLTVRLTGVTGSVAAALSLHDLLTSLPERPAVVAGGMIDTAGAIVLAAGAPGHRRLLPHASVRLARIEPSPPAEGDVPLPVEAAAAEVDSQRRAAESILGTDLSKPRLLSAADAVAAGLADGIA